MILDRTSLRGMGMSVIPGITQLTPMASGQSARLNNGMGFGLGGLGIAWGESGGVPDTSGFTVDEIINMARQGLVAWNAQTVFDINLDRLQRGLPPIPTTLAAPTVNVGLAGISPAMLLLAAIALIYFLKKK